MCRAVRGGYADRPSFESAAPGGRSHRRKPAGPLGRPAAGAEMALLLQEWVLRKVIWAACESIVPVKRISTWMQVHRNWRDVLLDFDVLYVRVAYQNWPDMIIGAMGADFLALKIEENIHLNLIFRGFGLGSEYEQSDEAKARTLKIDAMRRKNEAAEKRFLSTVASFDEVSPDSAGQIESGVVSWRDYVKREMERPVRCKQCNNIFTFRNNTDGTCRYHTRGAGTIFDWDEDDFIGVAYTCCNAKNSGAPGCKVGPHNAATENGLFSDGNRNRDWSTAHM